MKTTTVMAVLALFAAQSLAAPRNVMIDVIGSGKGGSLAVCGSGQWSGCKREAAPEPEPEPKKLIVDVMKGGGGGDGMVHAAVCGTGQWSGCKREAKPEPEPKPKMVLDVIGGGGGSIGPAVCGIGRGNCKRELSQRWW
ncbi:hypothetical protein HII31_05534 [Pseudocercospora fuligena]|uniref:Uncharacterized protein n=1 Tax=Pseudocercospora fuligena TaxID=685502 RepID=A0A8H6VNF4_9PEZI|nr:hypothetical protein HII31_05534 [Pseudocercospora fuligena]